MTDKIRAYLDGLFSTVPATEEVNSVRDELYDSMVERYKDCLADGMDEQEAYDTVIDSVGDIRELFDELLAGEEGYSQGDASQSAGSYENTQSAGSAAHNAGRGAAFTLNDLINGVSDFAEGLVSGLFGGPYSKDLHLVNSYTLPLDNIQSIDVAYLTESISFSHSESGLMVVNEYMNRDDSALYADVSLRNGQVTVHHGKRQGVFGLRSRIEILLPATWGGSLKLTTVSGGISSPDSWTLSSLVAKTTSGAVEVHAVEAGMIQLSSISGSVRLGCGRGVMELRSISGSVKVEEAYGQGGTFKSTSGSVRARFTELTGHVDASTISGGVRLDLPPNISFELDAKSTSGSIHTAFDQYLTYQKRNKAHGFVGDPPFLHIRASSTSGGIHIND